MKLWQNFKKFAIMLLVGGCVAYTPPSDYVYKQISAPPFELASWQKIERLGAPLTVYIEGDGYSFNSKGQATDNPTPRKTTLRRLAFKDKAANVVYLARPCQFVHTPQCHAKYWTTGRFAPEVINAEAEAVRQLMKESKSAEVILVGYSGGAMVAGLIATQNPDIRIKKIITIAGLLNHSRWTAYHHLPPLAESLDLDVRNKNFAGIPQQHFLGREDKIIPQEISPIREKLIIMDGATHNQGWDDFDLSQYK